MITYSIIQKSQLEGALRLDAEYYQPEYLDVVRKISKLGVSQLKNILDDIRYGLYVEPDYQDEGVNFLRALNLVDYGIDGEILKIKAGEIPNKKYLLNTGDILIVRSGANTGNVGIIEKYLENSTFGSYTICLRTTKINPYFLYIFLNSKFGKLQTLRLQTGMAQPNLNIPNIEEINIPLNITNESQREIEKIVLRAFEIKENSKSLYSQAENFLLEELGLKNFKAEDKSWGVVNLSEAKNTNRVDAEYFQPKYEMLESKIKNYEYKPLEMALENVSAKFEPIKQPDKSFKYVELSNINASIGLIDGFSEMPGKEAPSRARRVLKTSDVIVSSVEGSLEKVALVYEDQKDFLASTGFFQFRSEEILPEVLLVLAKSIVFQWQLEKRCAGTILTAVPKESMKDILIPILPKPTQQEIADLVRKSHEARKKAKELLEQAKQRVESLIEG